MFDECSTAVIKIVGIGGAGIRVLESMINEPICGVEFIAVDTDVRSLNSSSAPIKIQFAMKATKGRKSGFDTKADYADESLKKIGGVLKGADLVILVSGMGGETGTDATQVVANAAKGLGVVCLALVTLPSSHEGKKRVSAAEEGLCLLTRLVDSLIIIPNDGFAECGAIEECSQSCKTCKAILVEAVRGLTDLVTQTGLMAIDYCDVKTVLPSKYPITFGVGKASGYDRALTALQKALHPISCGGVEIGQASGVLVTITGSAKMTMDDYNAVNQAVHEKISDDADIKIGVVRDDDMGDAIKVAIYLSKSSVFFIDGDAEDYDIYHCDSHFEIYAHPRKCNSCSFDFFAFYGGVNNDIPFLQQLKSEGATYKDDFRPACPNCGATIYRSWG